MTTAHRPTWKPAIGMSDKGGFIPTRSYSARDLPGYLQLKQRSYGQGSIQQLKHKDFRAELLKREAEAKSKKQAQEDATKAIQQDVSANNNELLEGQKNKKILRPGEAPAVEQIVQLKDEQQDQEQKGQNYVNPFPQDEDSASFVKESEDEDEDDSEDENEILLREFEKVKQQREREQIKKMEEKAKFSAANRETELLKGNPLIDHSYSLQKRWYEDTVFKNQAKKIEEKKTFVNDNVRSEFHRKFINKYVMR